MHPMVITGWMDRHVVMVPALLENSQLILEEEELEGNPVFVILGDYTEGSVGAGWFGPGCLVSGSVHGERGGSRPEG